MEENTSSFAISVNEDYESDFEYDVNVGEKRKVKEDLTLKQPAFKISKPNKQVFHDECAREQSRIQQQSYLSLDAYTRHKKLINDYVLCYRGATSKLRRDTSNYKTDSDIIRENHRFLWEEEDEAKTWGEQLAKKYYDRLFKEYCLCDLSRYKEKKIGMRWRTEKEVILGKGQFFCGNIRCEEKERLNSWEVLFGYFEQGEKKNALVKLRLCEKCSYKLNYGYKGKAVLKNKPKKSKSDKKQDKEVIFAEPDAISKTVFESNEKEDDTTANENSIWKQPVQEEVDQSKEDVFEEFLQELFL